MRTFVDTNVLAYAFGPDDDPRQRAASATLRSLRNGATLVTAAIDRHVASKVSHGDALVVEAARRARCEVLLTEDLHDGQLVDGLRVSNPFA